MKTILTILALLALLVPSNAKADAYSLGNPNDQLLTAVAYGGSITLYSALCETRLMSRTDTYITAAVATSLFIFLSAVVNDSSRLGAKMTSGLIGTGLAGAMILSFEF